MLDALEELEKPSDILVIGNGFDLHCGLKSSFKNFFDSELRFSDGSFNEKRITDNIWYLIFTYAFMLNIDKGGKLVPFVKNDNPLWMDVESYIDKVFKTKNMIGELEIYDFIRNKLNSKPSIEEVMFNHSTYINGDYKNQPYQIGYRVNILSSQFNNPEDLLMFELNNFEKDFANYLKKEIENNKQTYESSLDKFILNTLDNHGTNELFILSFNYSINFDNSIKRDNIINIHGSLERDNIIIGIGDYEKGGFPGRDKFKKAKRRVQYNYGAMKLPNNDNIKSVIFYGCSFSKQDWNYYKLLFRKYELEKQKVVFKFLYSDYCSNKKDNDDNRNKYYDGCSSAVNSYLNEINSSLSFDDLYSLGSIEFYAV